MNEEELKKARAYAFFRLSKQAMLSQALAKAMQDRNYSEEIISDVIQELILNGYLNDDAWVASYVRQQIERKKGPHAIKGKLIEKGVSQDQILAGLAETFDTKSSQEIQTEKIAELLQSKYHRRDLNDYKEKQKVIASLARRGFDLSLILNVLNEAYHD